MKYLLLLLATVATIVTLFSLRSCVDDPRPPADGLDLRPNVVATARDSSEPVELQEPPSPSQPALVPFPVPPAAPVIEVQPAPPPPAEFLPFPNGGESAFELKYAGLSTEELEKIGYELQRKLNENVNALLDERYSRNQIDHEEQIAHTDGEVAVHSVEPKGMGQTWKTARYEPSSSGMRATVVYLTELEYPELFDKKAEYSWVAQQWAKGKSASRK